MWSFIQEKLFFLSEFVLKYLQYHNDLWGTAIFLGHNYYKKFIKKTNNALNWKDISSL